jgi:hypothetical protein
VLTAAFISSSSLGNATPSPLKFRCQWSGSADVIDSGEGQNWFTITSGYGRCSQGTTRFSISAFHGSGEFIYPGVLEEVDVSFLIQKRTFNQAWRDTTPTSLTESPQSSFHWVFVVTPAGSQRPLGFGQADGLPYPGLGDNDRTVPVSFSWNFVTPT